MQLEELVVSFQKNKNNILEELNKETRSLITKCLRSGRPELVNLLVSNLLSHEIEEPDCRIRNIDGFKKLVSFGFFMSLRTEMRRFSFPSPEWRLDEKNKAYEFVKSFNVPTPKFLGTFDSKNLESQLPDLDNYVIKPIQMASALGVFIVSKNIVYDVGKKKFFDRNELYKNIKEIKSDAWIIESVIGEIEPSENAFLPARDLKFYTFFGKVELVLEVIRYPKNKYCWWDKNMNIVDVGKYQNELFLGNGFSKDELNMAELLGSNIPAPFLRIDFLKGGNEIVFGEFTPRPGGYHDFNRKFDNLLGEAYIDAEARLARSLLDKKNFHVK